MNTITTPRLQLLGWRALVQIQQLETPIELPDGVQGDKTRGVVVGLGDGRVGATDKVLPFPVKVGDTVLLGPYGVMEHTIDGIEYRIVSVEDIIAIIP